MHSTILVTGARSYSQVLEAFSFWEKLRKDHADEISVPPEMAALQVPSNAAASTSSEPPKIYLNSSLLGI
jgi:hypothetical protein